MLNKHDDKGMGACNTQYCRQEGGVTGKTHQIGVEGLPGKELVDGIMVIASMTIVGEEGRQLQERPAQSRPGSKNNEQMQPCGPGELRGRRPGVAEDTRWIIRLPARSASLLAPSDCAAPNPASVRSPACSVNARGAMPCKRIAAEYAGGARSP